VHLAESRQRYNAERAARGDPTDAFYHTAQWRRVRAGVVREEPCCRHCLARGKVTATKVVDHIVPVKHGGDMWERSNLQGLCNDCHEIKSASEGSRFGLSATRRRGEG
jgi:5-methylcytosine-specific restriction protein A